MGFSNKNILIYQFIESEKVNDLAYINTLLTYNSIICFDLEDSIDKSKDNFELSKQKVFNDIRYFLSNYKIKNLGIRLDLSNKNIIEDDLQRLHKILTDQHLQIFLPKLSTTIGLESIIDIIKLYQFKNFELIPIIETKLGMENLEKLFIISLDYSNKIAFGHCDYNLDCDFFPFHHHNSEIYWDWINKISQTCGDNITFLNSPYLNLNDDEYLKQVVIRLKNIINKSGQITLSLRQSKVCYFFNQQGSQILSIPKFHEDEVNQIEFAINLVDDFERYRVDGKNFAIVPAPKKMISPQEYVKAKRLIQIDNEIKY
ncbi:MAG: hypothetical protein WAR59_13815 [Ignavibacteriaceae bacterium]